MDNRQQAGRLEQRVDVILGGFSPLLTLFSIRLVKLIIITCLFTVLGGHIESRCEEKFMSTREVTQSFFTINSGLPFFLY